MRRHQHCLQKGMQTLQSETSTEAAQVQLEDYIYTRQHTAITA